MLYTSWINFPPTPGIRLYQPHLRILHNIFQTKMWRCSSFVEWRFCTLIMVYERMVSYFILLLCRRYLQILHTAKIEKGFIHVLKMFAQIWIKHQSQRIWNTRIFFFVLVTFYFTMKYQKLQSIFSNGWKQIPRIRNENLFG